MIWKSFPKEEAKEITSPVQTLPEEDECDDEEGDYEENLVMDISDWQIYKSQWYGFELKYPPNWNKPVLKPASNGFTWEYRYQFRPKEIEENAEFLGFDVIVYNINKVKEFYNTDEFPDLKSEDLKELEECLDIDGHLSESQNYPAERIYVSPKDICYNPALFFSLTRDNYIYNILPIKSNPENPIILKDMSEKFPEFIYSVSSFNLIKINRPKPITAPKPAWYKKDSLGRLVCAKKNDKPGKSKTGKDKHLDMECCLDPDEYPNPWCYYPPEKYGKYLK